MDAVHTTDLDQWQDDPASPAFNQVMRAIASMLDREGASRAARPAPANAAPTAHATAYRAFAETINWAKVDPDLHALRAHPRFKDMVEKADARLAAMATS
jgi:hypothetical protein